MEYGLKCVFWLLVWTLVVCCVISMASQCSENSRFAYQVQAYKKRHYRDIRCSLYRTAEQGEVRCSFMCNSHRSTCYFFLLDGHGADCIICDSNGGSLTPSNYSLTEDTIIYEKQDNEDGCSPDPCAEDLSCVDDISGHQCQTCQRGVCVHDVTCIVSYGPYGRSSGGYVKDDVAMKDNGFITAIHITIGEVHDSDWKRKWQLSQTEMQLLTGPCTTMPTKTCAEYYALPGSIGFTYGNTEGTCHGRSDAVPTTVTLAEGEYITAVSGGPSNDIIAKLEITTNKRTIGPFGAYTGDFPFSFDSEGRVLAYISGRAGNRFNNIAFHFYC